MNDLGRQPRRAADSGCGRQRTPGPARDLAPTRFASGALGAAGAAHPARRTWLARAALMAGLAALACIGGAGCGRGQGGAGPAAAGAARPAARAASPLPDACELLTAGDVEAISREVSGSLSSTLEDAVGKDPSQCTYSLGGVPPRVISLSLRRSPTPDQAASQQQNAESGLRSISAGAAVEDLPHLGDGAFWIGGQIDQLNVRHGDTLLVFTVQLDKDPEAAARALAGKALSRLAPPAARPLGSSPPGGTPAGGGRQPQGGGPG